MTERSSLLQGIQVGLETTAGTAVPADKAFRAIGIELGPENDFLSFRPMGTKFATQVVIGKDWSTFDLTGVGSYSELIYLFSSVMTSDTPATSDTTAKTWEFQPLNAAEDDPDTFTIEAGGSVRAHRATACIFSSVELQFTRDGIEVSGGGFGRALEDGVTMTATPTYVEDKPMLPQNVDVYIDSDGGTIGTTKQLRVLRATWGLGDRYNPVWVLNSAQTSYVAVVETAPTAQVKLLVEADAAGMGLLATARLGDSKLVQIKAIDADLAGAATVPYSVSLNLAGKVSDISKFSDEEGVYAIEYTMDAVYNDGLGYAMKNIVVNKAATL